MDPAGISRLSFRTRGPRLTLDDGRPAHLARAMLYQAELQAHINVHARKALLVEPHKYKSTKRALELSTINSKK